MSTSTVLPSEPVHHFARDEHTPSPEPQASDELEASAVSLNRSITSAHGFDANHSFAVTEPIDLVWKNVTATSADGSTKLLCNVTGHIREGLIGIMGPSGCGKTTLLNTLACRLDRGVTLEGELRINGEPYTTSTLKRFLGYVLQDDIHNPLLTVRETLDFVAEARLGHLYDKDALAHIVEDAMHSLSLKHCADTLVGTADSGISGGEKKRLSVAVELISKPKMLFLDEPTSNLDSVDALHFIQSMRNLVADTHCVVVCVIHQPQFKVFQLFDQLLLLRSGHIVYDGTVTGIPQYCTDLGSPCPPGTNPADHVMELIAPLANDSFNTEARKAAHLKGFYREPDADTSAGAGRKNMTYLREQSRFNRMLLVSFKRSMVLITRRKQEFLINAIITLANAFLIGLVFLRIGTGALSNSKRLPALFFAVVNQATFGAVAAVRIIPSDRASVLRDRASGHLSALTYFMGKVLAEFTVKLPFPIVFSIISYNLIGFQPEANHFFRYMAMVCMANWTGIALAFAASAIARTAHMSALVVPLVMEIARLFGGYFISLADLPNGLRWINYISYVFYSFNGVAQNELSDLVLDCAPTCAGGIGKQTLDRRGQYMTYSDSIGILVVYWFILLVVAYVAIRWLKS